MSEGNASGKPNEGEGGESGNPGGGQQQQKPEGSEDDKTAIFDKAFGKGAHKREAEIFEKLGVENLDAALEIIASHKKAKQEKAEADGKLKELLEEERAKALKLQQDLETTKKSVSEQKLKNAFLSKVSGRVVDAESAYKLADLAKIQESDDGYVGLDDVVDNLLKEKPFLASNGPQPKGSGTNPGQSGSNLPSSIKDMSDEEFEKLQARVKSGEAIQIS